MSYKRVIPRDLFNEASLLKMLGKLWVETEGNRLVDWTHIYDGDAFRVLQDEADGSIYVANVFMHIDKATVHLYRPLNSRDEWPLWLRDDSDQEFEDFKVFNDDGTLSKEMRELIG